MNTNNIISETKELLNKVKTLKVLGEIKREIEKRMDSCNPCLSCTEHDYSEKSGASKAFEECIELINEQIKKLRDE